MSTQIFFYDYLFLFNYNYFIFLIQKFQVYNNKRNRNLPYSIDELGSIEFTTTPYA